MNKKYYRRMIFDVYANKIYSNQAWYPTKEDFMKMNDCINFRFGPWEEMEVDAKEFIMDDIYNYKD